MKFTNLLCCLLCVCNLARSQSYIRGQVVDESNKPLLGVHIFQPSSQLFFSTGSSGTFGFPSRYLTDSVVFTLEGYETAGVKLSGKSFNTVTMKMSAANANLRRPKLLSLTNTQTSSGKNWDDVNGESYSTQVENEFITTASMPVTGFAMNVDKASYSNIRRFISQDSRVPPDAVRIEEMQNYFNLHYTEPQAGSMFSGESQLTDCPWNKTKKLLFLNVSAKKVDLDRLPPSNFVFLIDISGSMDMPNRLPLLKSAFRLLVNNLRPIDTVSIVVYGATVGVWMPATGGAEKQKIIDAIDELEPSGATPGASAIGMAYATARNHFIKGGSNRVILATDGDFNVGQTSEKELQEIISRERAGGINLTCLGVGMGNYKDSKLEVLAKRGNGNFAYLDNIGEAEKVLVTELTQTLFIVARDVYLSMAFNKNFIDSYRLIGFENRKDAIHDTTSIVDGGEVGSGYSLMAVFEVTCNGNLAAADQSIGRLSISYRLPQDSTLRKADFACANNYKPFEQLGKCYQFSASVALYGMILRESKYVGAASLNDVMTLAKMGMEPDNRLQSDFVKQVEKTAKLYKKTARKKKDDDGSR